MLLWAVTDDVFVLRANSSSSRYSIRYSSLLMTHGVDSHGP